MNKLLSYQSALKLNEEGESSACEQTLTEEKIWSKTLSHQLNKNAHELQKWENQCNLNARFKSKNWVKFNRTKSHRIKLHVFQAQKKTYRLFDD